MPRKGELNIVDADEQRICDNPEFYNVAFFQPGTSTRVNKSFYELEYAKEYAKQILKDTNRIRSAMIYAIDEYKNHALVGTIHQDDLKWKEVVPKTH